MTSASSAPTPVPKTSVGAVRSALRANNPISAPAMRPFTVDPATIPRSWERTSGVNQAVRPSRMPSAPPTSKATVIRLISFVPPAPREMRRHTPVCRAQGIL